MRHSSKSIAAPLACCLLLSVSACSHFKAKPAEESGFIKAEEQRASVKLEEHRERFPFHKVWVSKEWQAKRDSYTKVIIDPVNTQYLATMGWWQKQSLKNQQDLKKDTQQLAQFTRTAFVDAVRNDPKHRFSVVAKPGPNTLQLQIAITELIPSKAWLNTASQAAGFFVPGAGLLSATGAGSIAIEARLADTSTGKVVGLMADREEDKSSIVIDLASTKYYGGADEAVKDWAEQFVELANTPLDKAVADTSPFKIMNW